MLKKAQLNIDKVFGALLNVATASLQFFREKTIFQFVYFFVFL